MTDRETAAAQEAEDLKNVSADLPFEFQSKLFEQLAAGGIAGAGLTITLVGTILQGSTMIWIATVEFLLAGLIALAGQVQLIEALSRRRPVWRTARVMTILCVLLIGMGTGSLGMSVALEGKTDAADVAKTDR